MTTKSNWLKDIDLGKATPLKERRGEDRRKHERRYLSVPVVMLDKNNNEQTGQLVDIGAGGMRIATKRIPDLQDRVICYVDHLGRFEGEIIRLEHGHFALKMLLSEAKAERLDLSLTKFFDTHHKDAPVSDRRLNSQERRRSPRCASNGGEILEAFNQKKQAFQCQVSNISLQGIEIETKAHLSVGESVTVGMFHGYVIRITNTGYVIARYLEKSGAIQTS